MKTPGSGSRNHVIIITLITLFYYAVPVVEGAQEHAVCLREILHLRMALETFTTAALKICCVWCVTKEVGLLAFDRK